MNMNMNRSAKGINKTSLCEGEVRGSKVEAETWPLSVQMSQTKHINDLPMSRRPRNRGGDGPGPNSRSWSESKVS